MTGLAGEHRNRPGRQRRDSPDYRGEAGLTNGLGLSFMKMVLPRAWQNMVLYKNHS